MERLGHRVFDHFLKKRSTTPEGTPPEKSDVLQEVIRTLTRNKIRNGNPSKGGSWVENAYYDCAYSGQPVASLLFALMDEEGRFRLPRSSEPRVDEGMIYILLHTTDKTLFASRQKITEWASGKHGKRQLVLERVKDTFGLSKEQVEEAGLLDGVLLEFANPRSSPFYNHPLRLDLKIADLTDRCNDALYQIYGIDFKLTKRRMQRPA